MKESRVICIVLLGILVAKNGFAATYDATGMWTFSTTGNWVNPSNAGCAAHPEQQGNATITQTGNSVSIEVFLRTYTGSVSGNVYTVSTSYGESGGTTIVTISFTLSSSTSGSGTTTWSWTDGEDSCYGGSDIAFMKTTPNKAPQALELSSGYQFVSLNVEPDDLDMTNVLATALTDIEFVKDSGADMLRKIGPNWINNIGNWNCLEGFLVKMHSDHLLVVEGMKVDPTTPIALEAGYQFIAYLPSELQDASTAFQDIFDNTVL